MNEALTTVKMKMEERFTPSVVEAEVAAVTYSRYHIHFWNVVNSIGLKVKLYKKVKVDNQGAMGVINRWNVGGCTRVVEGSINYLRELKDRGVFETGSVHTRVARIY